MYYTWVDYGTEYEDEIETWTLDEDTKRFSSDDGIKDDHEYYISSGDYVYNKTYFCKVALDGGIPIAVMILLGGEGHPLNINPIIVNPAHRNQGHGTRIISEFIINKREIIGKDVGMIEAGIFTANKASIRAFERAGFVLGGRHKSGNFGYWVYPPSKIKEFQHYSIYESRIDGGISEDFIPVG